LQYGRLATVMGRYYAMDRDKRFDRVKLAYDALLDGQGLQLTSHSRDNVQDAIKAKYNAGETDEFFKPIIVDRNGIVLDGDVLIFFDFRSDRMREIVETIGIQPPFETHIKKKVHVYQMTQYNSQFPFPILFPPQNMTNVLSEWISKQKLRQYHVAETEKYAHVTFFFNGGKEQPFPLEERKLVDSPKVPTYDLVPEMSMLEVANQVAKAIQTQQYPFVMCNLAAPDMVGHTGKYAPAVAAVEACDRAIAVMLEACKSNGYIMVITADHGNAEEMIDGNGQEKTSHTTNLVPLIIANAGNVVLKRPQGALYDVAPTVLRLMGLEVPSEMTGTSVI